MSFYFMGLQHVNLIYDPLIPDLSTAQSYVLARLAARADKEHVCWPGLALLARETRMTERGVRKVLRELETKHLITRRKGNRETNYKSLYVMTYAVEHFKKLEQEKPAPIEAPANNHHPISPENEEFLQRARQNLAERQERQALYVQASGKEDPILAGWIERSERKVKELEQKLLQK